MSSTTTPDETPKKAIAKKVVSSKRRYFFPAHGVTVSSGSLDNAIQTVKKQTKAVKAGDE